MTSSVLQPADLERQLLRSGVGALAAGRPRCRHCGRTPLVGERVHLYEHHRIVCALCRPRCREAPLGSELFRGSEHGRAVRPAAPEARAA